MTLSDTLTIQTDRGPMHLPAGSTLADAVDRLLDDTPRTPEQVATAVNGEFVPRGVRHQHRLQHGDTVLCFAPITGG
jgi:sulfur carrier protein